MSDQTIEAPADRAAVIELHPRILRPATFPPFDVYVGGGQDGELTLLRRANEPVYANTWQKLSRGGIEFCYARQEDRDRCFDYVEENLAAILDEAELPAGQGAEWVYRVTCRAMEALFADPKSYRAYKRVEQLVGPLVQTIGKHPGIEWHMNEHAPSVYSTPAHSVNVAVLLVSLARNALGAREPDLLAEVAIGGLLHDVGKTMVPPEILSKPDRLTRGEFAEIRRHPRNGVRLTGPYLRHATTAQRVIGQHHENAAGTGYPDGRGGEAINVFARAARVIDVFDALTTRRPYGPPLAPYDALNTMVNEMRGQFDVDMLRKFIRHLGAEPRTEMPVVEAAEPDEAAPEPAARPEARRTPPLASRPIIRLAPEAPAPQSRPAPAPAEAVAAVPEPVEAVAPPPEPPPLEPIEELLAEVDEETRLMSGVFSALRDALAGPLGVAAKAAGREPEQPAELRREARVGFARSLFPLVWQLDEWRARLAAQPARAPEAADLRTEVLTLLRAFRQSVVAVLEAQHVEVVETPSADADPVEGAEARAGFLYHGAGGVEVLEPARFILAPDRRKAG